MPEAIEILRLVKAEPVIMRINTLLSWRSECLLIIGASGSLPLQGLGLFDPNE